MITLHRCPFAKHKIIGPHHIYPYLRFQVCPHRNRYFFKYNSPLKDYLTNHCRGFTSSSDSLYNINYLVIIIIKNCEDLGLIKPGGSVIQTTSYLRKAFKTTESILKLKEIRKRVVSQLEARAEKLYESSDYRYPIWCVDPEKFDLKSKINFFKHSYCSECLLDPN